MNKNKIKSIKKVPYSGKVYDLSFDQDHLFYGRKESSNNYIVVHNSLPDLDIDFEADTDHITNEIIINKYGKERFLSVGTFSTFNEKGCLKDVVRAYRGSDETGYTSDVFQVTKEMGISLDEYEDLEEWFTEWPKNKGCSERVKNWLTDINNKKILDQTLKLQGQIRGIGQHAAGIVITPGPCYNYIPTNVIRKPKGEENSLVTSFQEADKSGKDLSQLGILKLDRLKLDTLNVIRDALNNIREHRGEKEYEIAKRNIDHPNLNDPKLYEELRLALNQGIFQFESAGMSKLIKSINVDNFDELVAANALNRPGPLGIGADKEYGENKFNPDGIKHIHPKLKPILAESNGVLVYQEQVMFIAHKLAGMNLGESDLLRRAMDKAAKLIDKDLKSRTKGDNGAYLSEPLTEEEKNDKKYKDFQKYWNMFLDGALKNGVDQDSLEKIKEWMIKYLGYSFNKCLTENHEVIVKGKGRIKLLDVAVGDRVLGYDSKGEYNRFNEVKNIHKNGKKQVYRIRAAPGRILYSKFLECTLDHKIMTKVGMRTLKEIMDHNLEVKIANDNFKKIIEFDYIGEQETYDLEIDSDEHNYYANDVCVSNSHALSYTYLAVKTLYLKHYYSTEFYTSLLNHPKSSGSKEDQNAWLNSAISSALSKGIDILPPSRKSSWNWSVTGEKEISMGFSALDGFGKKAYDELNENLFNQKNTKFKDVSKFNFFDCNFSKFNKASFQACIKAGIFDDWSNSRAELFDLFEKSKNKKRKKADPEQLSIFSALSYEPELKSSDKFWPTEESQKIKDFMETVGVDLHFIKKATKVRDVVKQETGRDINSINEYTEKGYYYFILMSKTISYTKKGKKMLVITVGDGIKEDKLRIFGKEVDKYHNFFEQRGVYVALLEQNEAGFMNFSKEKMQGVAQHYIKKITQL